jgi:hypothetical protein
LFLPAGFLQVLDVGHIYRAPAVGYPVMAVTDLWC